MNAAPTAHPTTLQHLQRFSACGCEASFRALFENHAGLVYQAALRTGRGDRDLAEEVVQMVFTSLAQKARTFSPRIILPAWLHRHACLTARQLLRTSRRRRAREDAAALLQMEPYRSANEVEEVIDEALNSLPDAEREALAAVERAIATAEGNVAAQQKEVLSHEAERPEGLDEAQTAALLAEVQQQLDAAQLRADEARAKLLADDQCRLSNAALLDALMQARAAHAPYAALNELLGSADGTKFRIIAQRCTLDYLLEQANEQLRILAPRYRLETVPKSLGLLMVDEDMGGEKRSVASLSGGETFLVSLALALGLAGLTSHRLKVESLFIDEGFGSLDADTLGIAMSALMQLEAQGRKVGVISHVPEMSDAIPVQIRVKRKRGGESQILIMGQQPLSVSVQSL